MLVLLLGCGPRFSLSEVPVVGGTDVDRAWVREQLAQWEDAVGVGRVRLREVRLTTLGDLHRVHLRGDWTDVEVAGRYTWGTEVVSLALDAGQAETILRHELCHALVHQDDLDPDDSPLAALRQRLFDPDNGLSLESACPGCYGAAEQGSEAVAQACEPGPMWAAQAGSSADPDRDLAAWMWDRVWRALDAPFGFEPAVAFTVVATVDFDVAELRPTADPRVIEVLGPAGARSDQWLDLYTGHPVDPARSTHSGSDVPTGSGLASYAGGVAGWPAGPAAIVGDWPSIGLQSYRVRRTTGRRIEVHDGDGWRFLGDGVLDQHHWAFTADHQLWLAHQDGDRLVWEHLAAERLPGR